MSESNLGKWRPWYAGIPAGAEPRPYGTTPTYEMGAEWLKDCKIVADWGCGMGWFEHVRDGFTFNIDGTESPYADKVWDLVNPLDLTKLLGQKHADGIFMRGVIEHDYRWAKVLENAVASFTRRMCLVLFTPMCDSVYKKPQQLAFNDEIGVPDLSFNMGHLIPLFGDCSWRYEDVKSDTGYGGERAIYLEKR